MRNKLLFILLLTIVIISFPSICFSELKTIESEHCGTYLGDMKNKKELDGFRYLVKTTSITRGLLTFTDPSKNEIKFECIRHIFSNYLEKVVVVSHTEKGRNICNKVRLTFDPKVVDEYLTQENCVLPNSWDEDIDFVLTKKSDKIKIGLIIETKIPDLDEHKKELLENENEQQFFNMTERDKEKYKVIDRRHLTKILEEQKLSSSGITDSETIKLGKILNLDIIVIRLIYEGSRTTKVLKVDTGEVLLFKTYKTEEGWIYYGETDYEKSYYDKKSITNVSSHVVRVWVKDKKSKLSKDKYIQVRKENNLPIDGWDKFDHEISLLEVDCNNNTIKGIEIIKYNTKGEILEDVKIRNPETIQIIPGSMGGILHRKVCQE